MGRMLQGLGRIAEDTAAVHTMTIIEDCAPGSTAEVSCYCDNTFLPNVLLLYASTCAVLP